MSIKYQIKDKTSDSCVVCNHIKKPNDISGCDTCDWKICRNCFFDHLPACDSVMDDYQRKLKREWF